MPFKENLKAKTKLDRLLRKLVSTMKEPPGKWWVDKVLTQELLDMTDFEHKKFRDLHLYIRPLEGEIMEVLVFDNELPMYHTTVADVALRKSPCWQEMFSIRNIKKIMNPHDVFVSKGKESLKRIHANALALLDLTYNPCFSKKGIPPFCKEREGGIYSLQFLVNCGLTNKSAECVVTDGIETKANQFLKT
jgi:hypothetical protein